MTHAVYGRGQWFDQVKLKKMDASWISLRMTCRAHDANAAMTSFWVRFERTDTCGRFFDILSSFTDSRWSCNVPSYFPRSSTSSRRFPLLQLLSSPPRKAVFFVSPGRVLHRRNDTTVTCSSVFPVLWQQVIFGLLFQILRLNHFSRVHAIGSYSACVTHYYCAFWALFCTLLVFNTRCLPSTLGFEPVFMAHKLSTETVHSVIFSWIFKPGMITVPRLLKREPLFIF